MDPYREYHQLRAKALKRTIKVGRLITGRKKAKKCRGVIVFDMVHIGNTTPICWEFRSAITNRAVTTKANEGN